MAIFTPSIFADAVNSKMDVSLRIGKVAFDATSLVPAITTAGDSVHFPQINRVAQAIDVVKGTELVPAVIDMTDNVAPIKMVASPMRIYDVELAQIQGKAKDNVVEQVANAMAKRIDADLVVAMDSGAVYKTPIAAVAAITSLELQTGLANFGDEQDTNSFAGIIINSKMLPSFLSMPEFVSTNYTFQTGGNGLTADGVVGYYIGIPVILSNNGTETATGTKECKTYIVKKNALGFVFQKDVMIEEQREAKLLATDLVASSLYATRLIDVKGCVILKKTIV